MYTLPVKSIWHPPKKFIILKVLFLMKQIKHAIFLFIILNTSLLQ